MFQLIEKELGPIEENSSMVRVIDGTWPLYMLIHYILNIVGPSNITLTSFTFSEAAIRHLLFLKDEGLIKQLTGIFDNGNRRTKSPLLYFANEVFDNLRLSANHSKITVIENAKFPISIITSMNLSQNKRIENLTIDTRAETFIYLQNKIADLYQNSIDI